MPKQRKPYQPELPIHGSYPEPVPPDNLPAGLRRTKAQLDQPFNATTWVFFVCVVLLLFTAVFIGVTH